MATEIKIALDDLPPALTAYNVDIFVIDQLGGDGYTKKLKFSTLAESLSNSFNFVRKSGDTMTGALILDTNVPVVTLQAASKGYVDYRGTLYLPKSGGNLSGHLTLTGVPIKVNDAVNKNYVDAGFLKLSGGTLTDYLTLHADPLSSLHAVTKQYVDDRFSDIGDALPIGSVMYFSSTTSPVGWFECDGRVLAVSAFPDLFNVIGYTYGGGGNGFLLPDLRGEFLRGWDHSRGIDTGRVFGSTQTDAFQGHYHELYAQAGAAAASVNSSSNGVPSIPLPADLVRNPVTDGVNGTPRTASETRPRNVAMLPCIKYTTTQAVTAIGLSAQAIVDQVTLLYQRAPRAFVRFDGTTVTPTISSSYNISTVTRLSAGWYRAAFTTALTNNRYTVNTTATAYTSAGDSDPVTALLALNHGMSTAFNLSAASFDIVTGSTSALEDVGIVSAVVYLN